MQTVTDSNKTVNRDSDQLQLFEANLPAKPYCADEFAQGLRILPRRAAIRRRYIEPQPPWSHLWLLFDVDRDASWYAARDAGLPTASITAINPRNGHGHLMYGLQVPLRMDTWGGRKAPVQYAETIERAMTAKLRADRAYTGFTVKNPLNKHWTVLESNHLFTLPELHRWVGDLRPYRRRPQERRIGLGRNCETFDAVRQWAYRAVVQHKADGGSLDTWCMACTGAAEQFTGENHHPELQRSECRWIGSSIGKWTWSKFTAASFAAVQGARGKASGTARREAAAERNRRILALSESGATWGAIAEALGVSRSTVARVLRGVGVSRTISG